MGRGDRSTTSKVVIGCCIALLILILLGLLITVLILLLTLRTDVSSVTGRVTLLEAGDGAAATSGGGGTGTNDVAASVVGSSGSLGGVIASGTTTPTPPTTTTAKIPSPFTQGCRDVWKLNYTQSGIYSLTPPGFTAPIKVYCKLDQTDQGWLVIQHKYKNGAVFHRNWDDYKIPFGDLNLEFWMGLDNIHIMTRATGFSLRIRFVLDDGTVDYLQYGKFEVKSEKDRYELVINSPSPHKYGDVLRCNNAHTHHGMPFSTYDRNNDGNQNCANKDGAFWYPPNCGMFHPNAVVPWLYNCNDLSNINSNIAQTLINQLVGSLIGQGSNQQALAKTTLKEVHMMIRRNT